MKHAIAPRSHLGRLAAAGALALLTLVGGVLAQSEVIMELKLGIDRTRVRADKVKLDSKYLAEILERRTAFLAEQGATVEVKGADEIHVRLPLEKLTPGQERLLTRTGHLEFRSLEDIHTNLNPDGRYMIDVLTVQGKQQLRFRDRNTNLPIDSKRLVAKAALLLDNDDLVAGGAQSVADGAIVRAKLTEKAAKRLESFLKKPGRLVAVVLDEEIVAISAAVTTIPVKGQKKSKKKKDEAPPIPGQPDPAPPAESGGEVDIPGGFSGPEEAALLAGVLNAGELPFPLTIRSKQLVGAR
ncbi:MAG: hypothetical protein K0Q72_5141 [Armatimonadetes bacterium]|nr:hypothetical protein [Armatimonadota bacterium]